MNFRKQLRTETPAGMAIIVDIITVLSYPLSAEGIPFKAGENPSNIKIPYGIM